MTGYAERDGGMMPSGGAIREKRETDAHRRGEPPVESCRDVVDFRAYVYLVLMVAVGSTTAAAAKMAVAELPPTLVPAVRFGMAGLCLLPWVLGQGILRRMIRQDGALLLVTAALCVPINQGFFLSAGPIGADLARWLLLRDLSPRGASLGLVDANGATRPRRLWGVLASVAGIVIIGIGNYWNSGGAAPAEARAVLLADLLLVGAVLSWGGYIAASKPLIERHGAMPALGATVLVGWLLSVPLAVWGWPGLARFSQVSSPAWLALALLGFFITPLGWALQNLSLRRFDASQVATFSNASPFLTVIWGIWLFGELVTPALLVGGALTLGGIYWASGLRTSRRTRFRIEQAMLHARLDEPVSGV